MKPVILFRPSSHAPEEINVARKYCDVTTSRSECKDALVWGRYSVLPFYRELEEDLSFNGSRLINSWDQHHYIANFDYYHDIESYTFKTWFSSPELYRSGCEGPFVVKGRTNSRKHKWNRSMYAENFAKALGIGYELMDDDLIKDQGVIYRQYVPLKTFEVGINDQRFVNEWRVFFAGSEYLAAGYYWSQLDDLSLPYLSPEGVKVANEVAKIISERANFFAIDIAEGEDGRWWVVEVNDGCCSGLSMIDPDEFYAKLAVHMEKWRG